MTGSGSASVDNFVASDNVGDKRRTAFDKSADAGPTRVSHSCGLAHSNIVNQQHYSAVFVVNTPVVDNSGVAHALEHLIFRRSEVFNDPCTLFQLTSLTDLIINGSTEAELTYFHCESHNKDTFELGLRYLLNGLFRPLFNEEDLTKELYDGNNAGVIFRELRAQQLEPGSKRLFQIDQSDTSSQRLYQYGGRYDTIGRLSMDDLRSYHSQFYRPTNVTLITANADLEMVKTMVAQVCDQPASGTGANTQLRYQVKTARAHSRFVANKQLVRWWLSPRFYHYFKQHFDTLEYLLLSLGGELGKLRYQLNSQGEFSLDVISDQANVAAITQKLQQFVAATPPNQPVVAKVSQHLKCSASVAQLIDLYLGQVATAQEPLLIGQPNCYPLIAQPDEIPEIKACQDTVLDPVAHDLLSPLCQLSKTLCCQAENHRPSETERRGADHKAWVIPRLLTALYQRACNDSLGVATDASHCVVVARIRDENATIAALASFIIGGYPPFIAPRTQGHCYLISARFDISAQQLILFSAFDVLPDIRLNAISHYLLLLSCDPKFIEQSLTLAKIKYSDYYQQDMLELEDITTPALQQFLSELSESLISASGDSGQL